MKRVVLWTPLARADIAAIDREHALMILRALDRLLTTGVGDLDHVTTGSGKEYRLRVGNWRVRFKFAGPSTIRVLRVRHRSEAY